MMERDLQRLVKEGTIVSYEVLEQDAEGNVLEMSIRPYPPINKVKLSAWLKDAYDRVLARKTPSVS